MDCNEKAPRLSVVTPVRNDLDSLRGCCASVRRLAAELPTEHVVVDGDSRDGTREWLREAAGTRTAADSAGVPLAGFQWRSRPDAGMYEALNRAIALARGQYILHLNADEQVLPGGAPALVRRLDSRPGVDLAFGDYLLAGPDGTRPAARREIPARSWYLRNGVNYILSCAAVFRRELWQRVGPFDAALKLLGDKDWYLRALESGARFEHVPRYISVFILRGDNLSRSPRAAEEQSEVRRRHGARGRPVRWAARSARILEKALRGTYWPRRITFPLILPEGHEITVRARPGVLWREPGSRT